MQYNVTVTAGANQALASLMITLLDPDDRSVLFRPYYFNALMAVNLYDMLRRSVPACLCILLTRLTAQHSQCRFK